MKRIDMDWLDAMQFRILKEIIIFGPGEECGMELGRIFYKRKLSNSYCLEESGDKYPEDEIDKMILSAVRDQFPRSVTRSNTFLHTVDEERLQGLRQGNVVQCPMYFTPGLWGMNEIYDRPEGSRQGCRVDINIYTLYDCRAFQNRVFNAKFDLKDRSWLSRLANVEFE